MTPIQTPTRRISPIPDLRPDALRWRPPEPTNTGMVPLPLDPDDLPAPPAQPAVTDCDPELDNFVVHLVRALLDTISGRRAPAQLTRWVEDEVYADLVLRARLHQRDPLPLTLRTFRAQRVSDRAVEVSARVQAGPRHTAVALRLERTGRRWVCRIAEFGPLTAAPAEPLPTLRERRIAQPRASRLRSQRRV